ncbi:hypothetical protein GGR56DRAFT_431253 [Xylariaceae sp. FL0804]|nr:hypothetical protein GGR56DRAFT_431253 [Xylariaceae sp. FL0804]
MADDKKIELDLDGLSADTLREVIAILCTDGDQEPDGRTLRLAAQAHIRTAKRRQTQGIAHDGTHLIQPQPGASMRQGGPMRMPRPMLHTSSPPGSVGTSITQARSGVPGLFPRSLHPARSFPPPDQPSESSGSHRIRGVDPRVLEQSLGLQGLQPLNHCVRCNCWFTETHNWELACQGHPGSSPPFSGKPPGPPSTPCPS